MPDEKVQKPAKAGDVEKQLKGMLEYDGKLLGDPEGISPATGRKKEPLPEFHNVTNTRRR